MKQAYPSEPLPLKEAYPGGAQPFSVALLVLGFGVVAIGFCFFPASSSEVQTWQHQLMLPLCWGAGAGFAILAIVMCDHERQWRWKRAFLVNNADLHIDWLAVMQVSLWLKRQSGYDAPLTKTEVVACHLAQAIRARMDPTIMISAINADVWNAYQYFTCNPHAIALPPLSVPKKA